jgi:putative thioredoxin
VIPSNPEVEAFGQSTGGKGGKDMLRGAGQDAGTATATADGSIKDTSTQTFVKDVIEDSKRQPVLVDFWAEWCGPCKQLGPVLEKIVRAAKGKIKLVKMDIDKHPAVAGQLGIQSIPAVYAFVNGQPVDGFVGALPESQVVAFIERITKSRIGGEEADFLKNAEVALGSGDAATAADLFAKVLAQDGTNVAALAGLARAYVKTGALEQAKQTLAMVPEPKGNDPAVAAARAAIDLAEQAKAVGPIGELEAKVAANPLDHQARFDLAVALNSKGRRQQALDHLIEIVRRDRKWNDDGARKQLVQFFEAWGPADPATVEGRKRLSSILFA